MKKKYKITNETMTLEDGTVLHRIKALKSFDGVKKGELGGFIEKEENLSHEGNCWICNEAKVYGDARIHNNAKIQGTARIYDNARIYNAAIVCQNAKIYDDAIVSNHAVVFGNAKVYNTASVCDNAIVSGDAEIYGDADIFKSVSINNFAMISSTNDVLYVGPVGSRYDYTTFYKGKDNIMVSCGCFNGTIDEFEKKVRESHKDYKIWLKQYLTAIDFAKAYLSI